MTNTNSDLCGQSAAASKIRQMHAAYVESTGFVLPLTMDREAAWWEWIKRGFGPGDVIALIKHIKLMQRNGLPARSLKFRSFAMNPDFAEEDIAELRAKGRCHAPNPHLEEVKRATGRVPPDGSHEPEMAKPSAEILAALRAAAGMQLKSVV